ncbi:MAG TPA: metallopeptidase TldD-related protein [Actinomycetota bacterium]|nr:metallopeptidase TldD-related protein [Actinomycetota bacterium]
MELPAACERVLELSRADGCIAIAWHHSSANLRWALNTSTTNGVTESDELVVISLIGGRVGSVARSYFTEESLEGIVRESEAACEGKPVAEDAMPLLEGDGVPADWRQAASTTGIGVFAGLAGDLAAAFARAEQGGYLLFGYAEHVVTTVYLGTSTGLRRRHSVAEGKFQVNAKTPDFKASTWAGRVTSTFDDVDLPAIEERLRQRLEWSKKQLALPAGHYEVLLEPSCVADMTLEAYWSTAARDADEGRSVFSKPGGGNRIGEKIAAPGVTLYSDPEEPGFRVAPFTVATSSSSYSSVFDNGLATGRTDWIQDGVLTGLITTRHWAKETGAQPKPFVDNLIFPSKGPSLEEMIASTERALLVTCLWYIREVDPQTLLLTGLTRDGVFLVEDGEVRGAVNNFRFNMSPVDMLAQTVEIGSSESTLARELGDYFTFAKMPPIRVRNFHMSSVSESV